MMPAPQWRASFLKMKSRSCASRSTPAPYDLRSRGSGVLATVFLLFDFPPHSLCARFWVCIRALMPRSGRCGEHGPLPRPESSLPTAGGRRFGPTVHWGTLAGVLDQGRVSWSESTASTVSGFPRVGATFWRRLPDIQLCDATLKLLRMHSKFLGRAAELTGLRPRHERACGRPPPF